MIVGDKFNVSFTQNDYNTPLEAWELLLNQMRNTRVTFWLPFFNDGSIKKNLEKNLNVNIIHQRRDFFEYEPKKYDVIADNPSFFQKQKVFRRCLDLGRPFALLVPMETIERKYFSEMFKNDKRLQVIIPNKRYEFESQYPDSSGKIPFKTVWICWKMDLKSKNNLIFEG